jgi:hypothetical protein
VTVNDRALKAALARHRCSKVKNRPFGRSRAGSAGNDRHHALQRKAISPNDSPNLGQLSERIIGFQDRYNTTSGDITPHRIE